MRRLAGWALIGVVALSPFGCRRAGMTSAEGGRAGAIAPGRAEPERATSNAGVNQAADAFAEGAEQRASFSTDPEAKYPDATGFQLSDVDVSWVPPAGAEKAPPSGSR